MLARFSEHTVSSKILMMRSSEEQLLSNYGHLSPSELTQECSWEEDRARVAQLQLVALRSLGFESNELRSWLNVYTATLGYSDPS